MRILKFMEISESKDLTPEQFKVKLLEFKGIVENIEGMLVDLHDENIRYNVEPSNDTYMKEYILYSFIDFSVLIEGISSHRNEKEKKIIYDKLSTIVNYTSIKGYESILKIETSEGVRSTTSVDYFEEFYYKYYDDAYGILLKFEPSTEVNEALPNQKTVDQLKKVMKMSASTDIGNRISDMNKQGANIDYIQNPIDTGIESYEDYEKHNKKFVPSWNLKHLIGPFAPEPKPKVKFDLDYEKKQGKVKK